MKTNVLVVGLLGSVLGGMAGSFLTLKVASPDVERERVSAGAREEDEDLDDDLDSENAGEGDERERMRNLEHRVSLLTAALSRKGGGADMKDTIDAADEGTQFSDVADPVFEAAVLDIMDREQERKEGERETFRTELRAKRGQQFADRLTETLSLRADQREEIAQAITKYFETMHEMRNDESPDRPVTRKEWRERMEALNAENDKAFERILDADQLSAYQALDEDEKVSFGRGWGRGREGNQQGSQQAEQR